MTFYKRIKFSFWKIYTIRKRLLILTALEIITPIIIIFGYILKLNKNSYQQARVSYCKLKTDEEFYNKFDQQFAILFAPATNFTLNIMVSVATLLKLNASAFRNFSTEEKLNKYFQRNVKLQSKIFGVIFEPTLDDVPHQFQYTIKPYKQNIHWNLLRLYNEPKNCTDKKDNLYFEADFLPLKLALDMSYIKTIWPYPISVQLKNIPVRRGKFKIKGKIKILSLCTICGYMFSACALCHMVLMKANRVKMLTKSMGQPQWFLWIDGLLFGLTTNIPSLFIVSILFTNPVYPIEYAPFQNSNMFLIYLFMLLNDVAARLFCFFIVLLSNKALFGSICGIVVWLLLFFIPVHLLQAVGLTCSSTILFPNAILYSGFKVIGNFENTGIGLKWNNLFSNPTANYCYFTFGQLLIYLTIHIFVYFALLIFFDYLISEPYSPGLTRLSNYLEEVTLPMNVVIFKNVRQPKMSKIEENPIWPVGIEVKKASKRYGNILAVNDLSINIYEGQLTALLGPLSAGKTTMLHLIAGIIGLSEGDIFVNNCSVRHKLHKIRNNLGFCPQISVLFQTLTVEETLRYFGSLKMLSENQIKLEMSTLLNCLKLYDQRNCSTDELPYGIKRKLSIAIAVIGRPKVILLDEPTSGLDKESQNEIWNILSSLKSTRTIFFSTQNMEEPDLICDRIAIINQGNLVCYGSPRFLKEEFGSCYQLTITFIKEKDRLSSDQKIINMINQIIPNANIQCNFGENLSFLLPHNAKFRFSLMFRYLEQYLHDLDVRSVKLTVDTFEEIFLKACGFVSRAYCTDSGYKGTLSKIFKKQTRGKRELKMIFFVLIQQWYRIEKRIWFSHLFQVLVLILTTLVTLYSTNSVFDTPPYSFNFDLKQYSDAKILYSMNSASEYFQFRHRPNVAKIFSTNSTDIHQVSDVTREFNVTKQNKTIVTTMYSKSAVHAAPIAITYAMNIVIKSLIESNYSIASGVELFPTQARTPKKIYAMRSWGLIFPLGIFCYTARFLILHVDHKVKHLKHSQLMMGISYVVYWISFYVWNLFVYVVVTIMLMVIMLIHGICCDNKYCSWEEVVVLFLILVAYGCTGIPYIIIYSFNNRSIKIIYLYIFCTYFIGFTFITMFLYFDEQFKEYWIHNVLLLFPPYGFCATLTIFAAAVCKRHGSPCVPSLTKLKSNFNAYSYYLVSKGMNINILIMLCSTLIYVGMIALLESKVIRKWWYIRKVRHHYKRTSFPQEVIPNVIEESVRVRNIFDEELQKPEAILTDYQKNRHPDVFLAKDIEASYKNIKAVKGITFGLKLGERLGILGASGAGKTTALRVLSGDFFLTSGDARLYFNNQLIYLSKNYTQYMKYIGYCPQENGIVDFLTGREMFSIYANLQGTSQYERDIVSVWINALGLEDYADNLCKTYTLGNKRKLSVGLALIGSPLLLVLDEPTCSIDPDSRRKLWTLLNLIHEQDPTLSIILATHNIKECETICQTVAILKSGRFICFNKISKISDSIGQGISIVLKTNMDLLRTETSQENFNVNYLIMNKQLLDLQKDIALTYENTCTLINQYAGVLHYRLRDDDKPWSKLFEEVEELKKRHEIIQDYDVNYTMLDDSFRSVGGDY